MAVSKILGVKPGHDGTLAYIENGKLKFSFEAEKDNGYRYSEVNESTFLKAFSSCSSIPDVIAFGGWSKGSPLGKPMYGGYLGVDCGYSQEQHIFGKKVTSFTSSHERSHIFSSYAMSPYKQGEPCYALVWEGHISAFYYIDKDVKITKIANVLSDPGIRYAFLYALANPEFNMGRGAVSLSDAGKLMAISSYGHSKDLDSGGKSLLSQILSKEINGSDLSKEDFLGSEYYNCGVTNKKFSNVAKAMSESIFAIFENTAKENVKQSLPLLISGGCGLNCDWNSQWKNSGLFSDVFIPPCANDSGSAIGTAVDAMFHLTGKAKLEWSVYSGELPVHDVMPSDDFIVSNYTPDKVALLLSKGLVLGWVKGRYEIGPRALGARSILACPRSKKMLERLNKIKKRESFRPIAPLCIADDMGEYFFPANQSPYMLEFRDVISDKIPAVTHVDGSARPQSVSSDELPDLYSTLLCFKQLTGVSVLCNTSLNFNGYGFINQLSDLQDFSLKHGLDGFIFDDKLYLVKGKEELLS